MSLSELCGGCVLSFARFIGSCRWLWLTSSLYFLCHIAVSLYTLLTYFAEHCMYDYHYLLLVYCLRSLLALRIVWWQTQEDEAGAQQAVEPGTFDRFLKNWSDIQHACTHIHTRTQTTTDSTFNHCHCCQLASNHYQCYRIAHPSISSMTAHSSWWPAGEKAALCAPSHSVYPTQAANVSVVCMLPLLSFCAC